MIPCTGGYGSCGTLRIRDPEGVRGRIDYIDHLSRTVPHWFGARYLEFAGQQNKLPFDAHTLVALIAPRPFLNTNATDDEYNNTLSIEAGIRTGRLVYDWMQLPDGAVCIGVPASTGRWKTTGGALLDFADECFFGRKGAREFNQWVLSGIHAAAPLGSAEADWEAGEWTAFRSAGVTLHVGTHLPGLKLVTSSSQLTPLGNVRCPPSYPSLSS